MASEVADFMLKYIRGLHETQDDSSGHLDCDECGYCVTCRDCDVYGCGISRTAEAGDD